MTAKLSSFLCMISTNGIFQLKKYSKKDKIDIGITNAENKANPQKNTLEIKNAIFFIVIWLNRFQFEFQCLFLQFVQK